MKNVISNKQLYQSRQFHKLDTSPIYAYTHLALIRADPVPSLLNT